MSEELKPCPFCGGEADPEGWMNGDGECGPECESCGATASSVVVWNHRAELAALKVVQGGAEAETAGVHCTGHVDYAPPTPGVVLPEVSGLGRDAEHPRALILYLRKEPSDDDIRAIQEALRADR